MRRKYIDYILKKIHDNIVNLSTEITRESKRARDEYAEKNLLKSGSYFQMITALVTQLTTKNLEYSLTTIEDVQKELNVKLREKELDILKDTIIELYNKFVDRQFQHEIPKKLEHLEGISLSDQIESYYRVLRINVEGFTKKRCEEIKRKNKLKKKSSSDRLAHKNLQWTWVGIVIVIIIAIVGWYLNGII